MERITVTYDIIGKILATFTRTTSVPLNCVSTKKLIDRLYFLRDKVDPSEGLFQSRFQHCSIYMSVQKRFSSFQRDTRKCMHTYLGRKGVNNHPIMNSVLDIFTSKQLISQPSIRIKGRHSPNDFWFFPILPWLMDPVFALVFLQVHQHSYVPFDSIVAQFFWCTQLTPLLIIYKYFGNTI